MKTSHNIPYINRLTSPRVPGEKVYIQIFIFQAAGFIQALNDCLTWPDVTGGLKSL